jgi:hypothetical protein
MAPSNRVVSAGADISEAHTDFRGHVIHVVVGTMHSHFSSPCRGHAHQDAHTLQRMKNSVISTCNHWCWWQAWMWMGRFQYNTDEIQILVRWLQFSAV